MSNNKQQSENGQSSKLPLAGLLGAAAVGAVYLYGKNKQRVQQRLRGWMLKVKGEVMERVAESESLTREEYEDIVDSAVDKYKHKKQQASERFEQIRQDLKAQWEEIHEEITQHAEAVTEEGGETMRSAISAAIAGAADEIVKKHDSDMDTLELLKKAVGSGASEAKQEVKKMIANSKTEVSSDADANEGGI